MSKKKKIILSISITVAVLGAIVALLAVLKSKTRNKKTIDVYPVNEIATQSGDMGFWQNTLSGNVTVNMEQKIYLSSSDQVAEVKVKEGDVVKAGDVLMVYDTTSQQLQIESMRADVEIARTDVAVAERELKELQNTTPVEPTTEEPTTEEPTTEEPTTEEPTTEEPTTEEPTTEEPTTEEPTTEEPTTEEPTTEEPVTEEEDQDTLSVEPKNIVPVQKSFVQRELDDIGDDDIDDGEVTYTQEELNKAIAEKQSEIKQLNIEYQLKQVELQLLEVQSPTGEVLCNFDGVVKTVLDQETAIVNNEPFIVVSGDDGYTVQAYIGEMSLPSVQVGSTVSMYSYDNDMRYTGVITEISDMPSDYNYYGSSTETYYPMKIAITEGDDLQQGMYMEITLDDSGEDNNSLYIPMALVNKEHGAYYVMKEENGRLKKVFIKTGQIIWGDTIEVKSGVSFDDYLAIPYAKNAQEGVRTVEKTASDMYGY